MSVPELSMSELLQGDADTRLAFGRELMRGLQRYGFVTLRDHDVPVALLDRAYSLAQQLFALPEARKRAWAAGLRGYTPFGTEHARDHATPDLKEFWQIGRDPAEAAPGETLPANVWPDEPADFEATFRALYGALNATGVALLEALAPQFELPPGWFTSRVARGNSILRIIHYPPVRSDADPRALRSAAHEDINFLTILVAARGAGLELRDRDGRWLPIETAPHNLIVDSGDMLARLTNGVIPATTHRVVNPSGPNVSRYSMPFFMHPTDSTSLACLPACRGSGEKFAPITAGEFLAQRVREIGLVK